MLGPWGQARQPPVNYLKNQTIRRPATSLPTSCWPLITDGCEQAGSDLDFHGGPATAISLPCPHPSLPTHSLLLRAAWLRERREED